MSEQATQINISDVEILDSTEDIAIYGGRCIQFNITVGNKTARFLEWFDVDGRASRTDSHLEINESDELAELFGVRHDLIPFAEIFDELDAFIKRWGSGLHAGCLHNWGDWEPYGEYGDASESIARCTKCPESLIVSDRRYLP